MPPKRRAKDTASPARPSASRSRSTRASKASPATDGNESEVLPTRPAKRARAATSKAARQDEDLDDDLGGYGRGSFKPATIEQHLMDQNKKSKEFIQEFKEQVVQGRERVQDALTQLKQDLINPPDLTGIDNLAEVYTALQTTAPRTLSTKDNPLFQQTQQLLRLSRALLKCHQTVDQNSRPPPELASPRETWMQDEEGLRKLLEYGRVFGEKVVEGWITPSDGAKAAREDGVDDESSDGGEGEGLSEAENLAKGLFEWRRKGCGVEGQESWGVAARKQMIALAGVVRTIPSKETK